MPPLSNRPAGGPGGCLIFGLCADHRPVRNCDEVAAIKFGFGQPPPEDAMGAL